MNEGGLQLRRHEKDYLVRFLDKYLKKFSDRIATFTKTVKASSLGDADKSKLLTQLKSYNQKFENWSIARLKFNGEVSQLSQIYAEFSPIITQMIKDFEATSALSDQERWRSKSSQKYYKSPASLASH